MNAPTSLPADASTTTSEDLLDLAIELTFPASDPISVVGAYRSLEDGRTGDAGAGNSRKPSVT